MQADSHATDTVAERNSAAADLTNLTIDDLVRQVSRTEDTRDDAWLDTFQTQLTEQMIDRVRAFARVRAFGVALAGRAVDDYYARELVQDAIGDTWAGIVAWDPQAVDLESHLTRVVQSRSRHDRKHAADYPHDAIGQSSDRSVEAESQASQRVLEDRSPGDDEFARERMGIIRRAASADRDVLRILDAYDADAKTKGEVMAHARMKTRTYHNARIRLARIVRNLSTKHSKD